MCLLLRHTAAQHIHYYTTKINKKYKNESVDQIAERYALSTYWTFEFLVITYRTVLEILEIL